MTDTTSRFKRSSCPIAVTLDVVGDRWTLIVARDLLYFEKRRFGEFLESPEGIPTNILADRLKRMQVEGLVEKKRYQERPARYAYVPTDKLRDLRPVLREIAHWANTYYPETFEPGDFPGPT